MGNAHISRRGTAALTAVLGALIALAGAAGCAQPNAPSSSNAPSAGTTGAAAMEDIDGLLIEVRDDPVASEQKARYQPGTYAPETGYVNASVGIAYPALGGFDMYSDDRDSTEFIARQRYSNASVTIAYATPLGEGTLDDLVGKSFESRKQRENENFKVELADAELLGEQRKVIVSTVNFQEQRGQLVTAQAFFEKDGNVVVVSVMAPYRGAAMSLLSQVRPAQ